MVTENKKTPPISDGIVRGNIGIGINTPVAKVEFNWEALKKALYDSDLVSGEQTDDNTGEDDIGSYWLNDCTVDEVIDVFKKAFEK